MSQNKTTITYQQHERPSQFETPSKIFPQFSSSLNQGSQEKKNYFKNEHQQQKFFSIQRNNHQPSRHFSPEKQLLELPILNSTNIGEMNYKRLNEFKTALNQTRKFRNGSLNDNYYSLIQQIKRKHRFDEEQRDNSDYTYQTSDCNRNKILANAMFNIATPFNELNHINQQTCFNLDMNLWLNKQKQNLNNSLFALAPIGDSPQNNFKKTINKPRSRILSLPPTATTKLSEGSQIINKSYQITNSFQQQQSQLNKHKKLKTQQSSLSPAKTSLFDENFQLKEILVPSPKKKILEINFATGMSEKNKKKHGDKTKTEIIHTPYIDKAIQIIEEKYQLDNNNNENENSQLFSSNMQEEINKKKLAETQKDPFIKIDGGFGDYILRYHHIKQRIQNKLIPQKVAMPNLSNLLQNYQELEAEIERKKEEQHSEQENTPIPQTHKKKNQLEPIQFNKI
ncbi:hypothetical protein TTHERM_00059060 (macronuclear) [Tetrahymena thermophila SB210]|uniref:Uncharacterized protein n=1 Tax=Tetrahymena thermophila (strain SB210) TaxID=312017 RepID=I7M0E0_TETTS|nr:hypothetical protein TTHERM_00059060 [Tetrahymena thermophila SB210]EAR87393.1 hypothetical protein TTHERM_00059060 [Tetrahymena thermophila SB210]|eukprot:XP_001007638.1 hypothetical protein TTHERM_00059060 [Tetrahymena thermophila SB210]